MEHFRRPLAQLREGINQAHQLVTRFPFEAEVGGSNLTFVGLIPRIVQDGAGAFVVSNNLVKRVVKRVKP